MAIQIDSLPVFYRQRDSLFFPSVIPKPKISRCHRTVQFCSTFSANIYSCVLPGPKPSSCLVYILYGKSASACLQYEPYQ